MHAIDSTVYRLALGQVISALRRRAQISQADFANSVGISQPTLSRIERGESTPDVLLFNRIAEALELTHAELQAYVEATMQRARIAAVGATQSESNGGDVWGRALQVAGLMGLAGLIAFAVAIAISDRMKEET